MRPFFLISSLLASSLAVVASTSRYPLRPDDPAAVYVTKEAFGVHADGLGDDTAALQAAIDRVQETTRRGIVFLPEGRYRLTKKLLVWSGIRLIGYGAQRPVLVLGPDTPGYQTGDDAYLVHFVSDRPPEPSMPVRDANPGTFYSAISNIDVEIGEGNPAAVGVRAHFAQHCFLSHMEFRLGSARAGVEEVGNEFENLRFIGGEFGITMHKPSPSWPFVLLDSTFEGQRRAAIETEEGGLTIIRGTFRRVPTAVLVREARCEELWLEDSRLENVSGPAIVISEEKSARTQISLRNVACSAVPVLARFRESGREIAGPAPLYAVREFCHGLHIADLGAVPELKTTCDTVPLAALPAPVPSDVAPLPPMETWANLRALGAKGDGVTDDTAVLRAAIAAHRTIYLPTGRYRVTDTIALRPDTVLVGFNPITTQILIADHTPAFQGVNGPATPPEPLSIPGVPRNFLELPPFAGTGAPVPLLETPRGGSAIVTGLGLDTGGLNNRAVALLWRSGSQSLVNDVRFLGGHGTYGPDGHYLDIYNNNRTADPDARRRWDSQYPSLWVTDGGGGTFKDIWTPSPYAAAGLYVSDTDTPGRIYALSAEHHVRREVKFRNVANWRLYALQTEEERGESQHALPLELDRCRNLTVVNFFIYRVGSDTPFPTGIRVTRSENLHFRGLHAYSPGKHTFDNTLTDATHGVEIRSREIAWLHLSGAAPAAPERADGRAGPGRVREPRPLGPPSFGPSGGARLEKLAGGFNSVDALAVDAAGDAYFADARWNTIHRWSVARRSLDLVTDAALQPAALAFDRAGHLLVVSSHGNVYALRPDASESTLQVLAPVSAAPRPEATAWLPVNRWRDGHDWLAANTRCEPLRYMSPDGSVFIPAPEAYPLVGQPGKNWRLGTVDLARAYALTPARVGEPFYVSDEFGQATWRFTVQPDGTLAEPFRFAEEGEAGTAVDAAGNVYVCAGHVFVYDRAGRLIDTIEVPERPTALAFGGPDRRTLFITARSSLYALRTRAPGR